MKSKCLTDENLIELFYEPDSANEEYKIHMSKCSECQLRFSKIIDELTDLGDEVPDCDDRIVDEIERIIESERSEDSEFQNSNAIMTIEDVAKHLNVTVTNVSNMLHDIPHFVFDGEVRFRFTAINEYIEKLEGHSRSDAHRSKLRLVKFRTS